MSSQNKGFLACIAFVVVFGLLMGNVAYFGQNAGEWLLALLAVAAVITVAMAAALYAYIRKCNSEAELRKMLEATAYERTGWTAVEPVELPPASHAVVSVQTLSRRTSSSQMMTAVSPRQLAAPVSSKRPQVTEASFEQTPRVTAITVQRTYGRVGEGYPLLEPVRTGILVSRKV